MEFYDITYIYVFEVGEFNGVTFRTLPPPVDLENPVWTGSTRTLRLPIFFSDGILWYYLYLCFRGRGIQWWHFQNSTTTGWPRKTSLNRKYLNFEVTHLFLWWNFIILPIFMFSRSGNSMVTLSEFYHHRLTSKNQFEPEVLELWGYPSFSLMEFYDITYIYVFEVGEFNGVTFRTLPPPVDLENPVWTGSTRTLRLPIFFSDGILWYYLYLCFRGRGIQWWHFQNSTTTGWPRKTSLNRKYLNFEVTHLFLWWNFMILPIFMFSRSGNSMVTLSEFYHHRLTSKNQFEPEVLELWGYPSFSLVEFYDITYIYVFEVGEYNGDTFRILTPPDDLEKPVWTGSTWTLRLPIFFSGGILWYYLYLCLRGRGIQW